MKELVFQSGSIRATARAFQCSERRLRALVANGALETYALDGARHRPLLIWDDVKAYLRQHSIKPRGKQQPKEKQS